MADPELAPSSPDSVSAIVVTFGSRPYLPALWEDLAQQTHRPFEVVVVDNNSPDGSAEYVREHPLPTPLRLLRRPNQGIAPAWNTALANVRSAWMLLLSPDCRFPPELTSRLVRRAQEVSTSLGPGRNVGGVSPVFRWNGKPGASLSVPRYFSARQPGLPSEMTKTGEVFTYHGACALLSTEFLRRLGGWDELLNFGGDEIDMGLRGHLLGYRFYCVPDLFVDHPFEPGDAGKKGMARRMRMRSNWLCLLKHAGITIGWGILGYDAVTHLFWNRLAASPRELAASAAWFVAVSPTLAQRRRQLRDLYDAARSTGAW